MGILQITTKAYFAPKRYSYNARKGKHYSRRISKMNTMDTDNHETLAQALFSIAAERWHPSIVNYELAEIDGILSSYAILGRALSDSGIPASLKREIITDVFGGILSPVSLGLLDLLIEENKVHMVKDISKSYRRLLK
jgi:F0F1-type ATP synthase delta subunit